MCSSPFVDTFTEEVPSLLLSQLKSLELFLDYAPDPGKLRIEVEGVAGDQKTTL